MPVALLLWAALAIPSWALVAKFTGAIGVAAYSLFVAVSLMAAPAIVPFLPRRAVPAMSATTFLIVLLIFALLYPRFNVRAPGQGSDDDDAHDVGVAALFDGESPYGRRTYLGNALHQLPGAYVLAAPFALVGASALQNLVCLPVFFVLMSSRTRDARTPLVVAWLALLLSPAVLHHIVTGSSYSWNAIWVLCGIWWIWHRPRSVAASVFCGVAMCSRPNFVLLLAPVYGALSQAFGRGVGLRAVALATLAAAALAMPFYFVSPEFGPLEGFAILSQFDDAIPGAGVLILGITSIVAIGLTRVAVDFDALMLQCALVQAIPVLAVVMLSAAVMGGGHALSLTAYASFASWFALMGVAARVERWLMRRPQRAVS